MFRNELEPYFKLRLKAYSGHFGKIRIYNVMNFKKN